MTDVLNTLTPILDDVTQRFKGRIDADHASQPNEVYFHASMDLVAGFSGHLYKKWNARLVSVFADDARQTDGAFLLYYVYALDSAGGFFILRVPVPADNPEFASLTNAIPAVNWQEREIQDLFGLKLLGHPNQRPSALHADCLELERIYNHIADIGAIATDVAFVVANMQAMRLKERVLRLNEQLTGNRLLRGMACLGGVRHDWEAKQLAAISECLRTLRPEFD